MISKLILHIDEAWRWPLAGPVSVWCAMKLKRSRLWDFMDSKILSEKRREELYDKAYTLQEKWKILIWHGFSSNTEIDTHWIIPALHLASTRAIFALLKQFFKKYRAPALESSSSPIDQKALIQLTKLFRKRKLFNNKKTHLNNQMSPLIKGEDWASLNQGDLDEASSLQKHSILEEIKSTPNTLYQIQEIIIDGNHTFWLDISTWIKTTTIIKGDAKVSLISLASIIAKVERDRYMKKISKTFPEYDFHQHKWYGTKKHRETIATYGKSTLHRASFCRNIV